MQAGSHNDEGERGSCTNGKKAWRGMVVIERGVITMAGTRAWSGEGHAGPLGRGTTTPAEPLLYVPNTRPYEGETWQIYGGMMYKLYVAIHGRRGMRKVDEIERAIERGFGLHTDDIKTLHSCTLTSPSSSCLPVVSQPKCALLKSMNL